MFTVLSSLSSVSHWVRYLQRKECFPESSQIVSSQPQRPKKHYVFRTVSATLVHTFAKRWKRGKRGLGGEGALCSRSSLTAALCAPPPHASPPPLSVRPSFLTAVLTKRSSFSLRDNGSTSIVGRVWSVSFIETKKKYAVGQRLEKTLKKKHFHSTRQ